MMRALRVVLDNVSWTEPQNLLETIFLWQRNVRALCRVLGQLSNSLQGVQFDDSIRCYTLLREIRSPSVGTA